MGWGGGRKREGWGEEKEAIAVSQWLDNAR